jgi:GNAT superfamily N-acetyltransferase
MDGISVREVTHENVDDLCRICVPPEKVTDPVFVTGVELKKEWAIGMLERWGTCAKLAYRGSTPVGMIQYWPVPEQRVIRIHCIYVPEEENWGKGIGTWLLSSLIGDVREPKDWFGGERPVALVTKTFPGESPGQYPARLFFRKKGFMQVGDDPDFLYYPLRPDFVYRPPEDGPEYISQEEDRGRAVFIYGPAPCPFAYVFLKRAERVVREVAPWLPVRWISAFTEPHEVEKRGGVRGCIVNARLIRSIPLDKPRFRQEVLRALEGAEDDF